MKVEFSGLELSFQIGKNDREVSMPRFEKHPSVAPKAFSKDLPESISSHIHFFFEMESLKALFRTGWVNHGIPRDKAESVADHSWSVALLADSLAAEYAPNLDRGKIMRMALMHELCEIYAGDLTIHDGLTKKQKHDVEDEAIRKVLKKLKGVGAEYLKLWDEFESGSTPEAQWVYQIDKLEMLFQVVAYRLRGHANLDEFFDYVEKFIHDPSLKKIFNELVEIARRQTGYNPPVKTNG